MVMCESQKEQLSWYEVNLPLGERKRRGHFSTPPALVESILDACGYTSEANLTHVRVLDPACGSGNFLVGAAQHLLGLVLELAPGLALLEGGVRAVAAEFARTHLANTSVLIEDTNLQRSPQYVLVLGAAHYVRGLAYEQKSNVNKARANFQAALKLVPTYEFARRALAHLQVK